MKGAYKHTVLLEYLGERSTSSTADAGDATFSVVIYNDSSTPFTRDTFFTYCNGKCLEAKGIIKPETYAGACLLLFIYGSGNIPEYINAYGASLSGGISGLISMANNGASENCYTITDYVEPNT